MRHSVSKHHITASLVTSRQHTHCSSLAPRRSLKGVAKTLGVKPKKSLGQNFLVDEQVISEIIERAHVLSSNLLLEIGPGTGALTSRLLPRCGFLAAIEADERLVDLLGRGPFAQANNLQVFHDDAVKVNMRKLLADLLDSHGKRLGTDKVKIVGNIPYHITTDILKILLPLGEQVSELFLMLQVEAAQRLTNSLPGNATYRAMNVLVDYYSSSKMDLMIDRAAFDPAPNVNSAMVRFRLKEEDDRVAVPSEQDFLKLVNVCFSARRKVLRNNLMAAYPPYAVKSAMHAVKLDDNIRPQELELHQFAALSRELYKAMLVPP